MNLTEKDIEFLGTLRSLMKDTDLWVERRDDRLILRKNYGEKLERRFNMTRQGVRWRFQRIAEMYLSAFQTILMVEQTFGSDLRGLAIEASKHHNTRNLPHEVEYHPGGDRID